MDQMISMVNKWTVSAGSGIIYYWANRLELLGESSDANIEPLQVLVVVVLTFVACLLVEWAYRRQGFLPKLTTVAESPMETSTFASMDPNSWSAR